MCLCPCPYWRLSCPLFPSYKDSVPAIHGAHLSTRPLSTCISPFMKDPGRFFAFLWGGFFFINMYNFIYGGGFPCCWCLFCLKHVPLKPRLASLKPAILGSQPPKCFWLQAKATTPMVSFIIKGFQYFYITNSANIFYYGVNSLCFVKEPLLLFNIIKQISCIGPCNFLLIVLL